MGILKNGTLWKDTDGAPVHAHGGYMISFGDIITGTERTGERIIM